jgi:hypothetical protein
MHNSYLLILLPLGTVLFKTITRLIKIKGPAPNWGIG